LVGIYLSSINDMRSFWPPEAPMGSDPPTCWSLGGKDAVPHPEATESQHTSCAGCPWNEFGTAKQGRGKACKTKRADFLVEVDEALLDTDSEGRYRLVSDAVLGIALIRCSATARETRSSIAQWAKDVRAKAKGIPQLVLTRWSFVETSSKDGVAYYAPTFECLGPYICDPEALEEVVQTAKDLQGGQAAEILTILAGRQDDADAEEDAEPPKK